MHICSLCLLQLPGLFYMPGLTDEGVVNGHFEWKSNSFTEMTKQSKKHLVSPK